MGALAHPAQGDKGRTEGGKGAIWERLLASAGRGPDAVADYVQTDRSFSGRLRRAPGEEGRAGPGVEAGNIGGGGTEDF